MGLFICQQCGVVLRQRVRACRDCGNPLSRHSPTLMPVLLAGRTTSNTPQALKPEHDTLLVERVVTRCRYNEAMQARPRRFHGSTAFFTENEPEGEGESSSSSQENSDSLPADSLPATAGEGEDETASPSNTEDGKADAAEERSEDVRSVGIAPSETPGGEEINSAKIGAPSFFGDDVEVPPPAKNPDPVPVPGRLSDPASEDFFADTVVVQPQAGVVSESATSPQLPKDNESKSESAIPAEGQASMDKTKLLRNAPLPSFMVADWLLLVVQESDAKTLSVSHTIEGAELPPVFGLLPGSSDPSLCSVQPQPDHTVSLSGSAAFLDANAKLEPSPRPEQAVNIDSRLAFEDGLSQVAALRLQGALGKSGVLGFEDSDGRDEFRRKFTRKPNSTATDESVEKPAIATEEEKSAEIKQPAKDNKGQKTQKGGKRSAKDDNDTNEKVKNGKNKKEKNKNPLAMIAAAIGVIGVIAFLGFILMSKFAPSVNEEQSTGGIPLHWHMRLMISEPYQAIFQEFDVNMAGDAAANISGAGSDQLGSYTISGQLVDGAKLSFQKQYDQGFEWPIMFSGRMEKGQNGSFATGTFVWRRTNTERIEGSWEAAKLQSGWLSSPERPEKPSSVGWQRPELSNRLSAASKS